MNRSLTDYRLQVRNFTTEAATTLESYLLAWMQVTSVLESGFERIDLTGA